MSADRSSTATLGRVLDCLAVSPVLPVLRLPTASAAAAAAARCLQAGVSAVELTATTPGWADALRDVRAAFPEHLIGVGTIRTEQEMSTALDRGADFLVSPCPVPAVRAAMPAETVLLEGGFTVGEVLDSASRGIAKLFPAHVGGIQYLRSILAVAPGARIVPTGGVTLDTATAWLAAGATAVGVGGDLLRHDDLAQAILSVTATAT